MSLVEKTIRRLQAAKEQSAKAAPNVRPVGRDEQSEPAKRQPPAVLDRVTLRAAGLLPPADQDRQLSHQYRKIKRPLIAHALGRGAEQLPRGYLIMVASAMPGEGKSFTAVNLALSLSKEKDLNVLLVDADVAKPHLSRALGLEGQRGLLDVLRTPDLDLETVVRPTDVPTLSFLPAGVSSADATELLASERMGRLAVELGRHDGQRIVLFDTSPLMQTTESPALARIAGQIVVVVRAESTPQPVVLDALEALEDHPAVALVLNQSLRSATSAYYYYGHNEAKEGGESNDPESE
jgi:exopolysaccharide/PEP-CTERM locus tyrosine autokinase